MKLFKVMRSKGEWGENMMGGSNSLEVVRNMKGMSLFTAVASLVLLVALVITPGLLATIGFTAFFCFIIISTCLFLHSMKQYWLWVANEKRLLAEVQSSCQSPSSSGSEKHE